MNFYPFHIGDYASHTRHLSLIEDLAYRRLIDAYYLAEKPFVGECAIVARNIGMREYLDEVQYILATFFEETPNGWINKRCDDEIVKYRAKADSARNANRIKLEKKSGLISEPLQTLTKNQEPITNNHKPLNTLQAPEGVSIEIWNDFVAQRKKARAVVSENVVKSIGKEAAKAGWTLEQALAECAARGWRGFKAEWVKDKQTATERGSAVMLGLTRGLVGGGNNGLLSK
jgi:uncharacterized protein YdaU (DUF1376 family)